MLLETVENGEEMVDISLGDSVVDPSQRLKTTSTLVVEVVQVTAIRAKVEQAGMAVESSSSSPRPFRRRAPLPLETIQQSVPTDKPEATPTELVAFFWSTTVLEGVELGDRFISNSPLRCPLGRLSTPLLPLLRLVGMEETKRKREAQPKPWEVVDLVEAERSMLFQ